ncbi:MAG: hypothetical protein HW391_966 [Chloroflexi bacterium]|nr:hypothetical protein [Chloroflexota bacterium]
MPADRLDDRDTPLGEELAEIAHLPDSRPDVLVLDGFLDADGERLHVPAGHPAVGVKALVDDDEIAQLLEDVPVVNCQPTADVDEVVLLGAHPGAVRVRAELEEDLGDRLPGVARLALLDEQGVLHHPGRVEQEPDAAQTTERTKLANVRHAHRLAAGHVDGARQRHVRDPGSAHLLDEPVELGEVHVPLEGMERLRVVRLIDDHVVERRPGQLLVQARGREVHVPGHVVARLDECLADEVLGAAALVGRHDVGVAVEAPDCCLEVEVVAAAGVRLVAEHHAGPLPVAHRRRPRVRQEVDVDVLGPEQKRVVAGLLECGSACLGGRDRQRLDHLDLPRLRPAAAAMLLAHRVGRFVRHRVLPPGRHRSAGRGRPRLGRGGTALVAFVTRGGR